MFRSLFGRLFATYMLLFFIIVSGLSYSLSYFFQRHYFDRKEKALVKQGEQLNGILAQSDPSHWNDLVNAAEHLLGGRIVVRRMDPRQSAALSDHDLSAYGDRHLPGDVRTILAGEQVTRKKEFSPLLDTDVVFVGLPLELDSETAGFILLFAPVDEFDMALQMVNIILGAHVAAGLVLAVVLVFMVSRRITRPLEALETAASKMDQGRLPDRVNVRGRDELARLAESFNSMAARMGRNEEVRREFFADISHELRAPLTTVRGFLQALKEGVVPANERQQYLQLAYNESGRLANLVSDLLELAKLQGGEFKLRKEKISVTTLIEELLGEMALRARERDVKLSWSKSEGIDYLCGDPERIKQVMVNLVDNAVRHARRGGLVQLQLKKEGDGVSLKVIDDGCGIAPEDLPFIFEQFYRVERSRDSTSGGAGLGLSIVKKLVEAHGGRVSAQSTPGAGSTIGFWLPCLQKVYK